MIDIIFKQTSQNSRKSLHKMHYIIDVTCKSKHDLDENQYMIDVT